jgi:hypothetical protein
MRGAELARTVVARVRREFSTGEFNKMNPP